VYARDEVTWRRVEWVAFETIPVLREIKAVRRAMGELRVELKALYGKNVPVGGGVSDGQNEKSSGLVGGAAGAREWWDKRFWICSAHPEGRHPQQLPHGGSNTNGSASTQPDIAHVDISEVVQALLSLLPQTASIPDGLGLNCTNPAYLAALTKRYTKSFISLRQADQASTANVQFMIYPDGGQVYDVVTRQWSGVKDTTGWAEGVLEIAKEVEKACMPDISGESTRSEGNAGEKIKVWGGVIVGGCCKAGFEDIAALRAEMNKEETVYPDHHQVDEERKEATLPPLSKYVAMGRW
jgi:homocysteine S-methyltransferase